MRWEHLWRISPRDDVITGLPAEPAPTEGEAPTIELEQPPTTVEERRVDELRGRPFVVFVRLDADACDGNCKGACERYFEADAALFGDVKVSLATRAFRTVWMTPEEAAAEPLLADTGDQVPRLVLLDVARDVSVVTHGKSLKAKRFYAQLKRVSDRFYKERLDGIVKKHLKLLDGYDKLTIREGAIRERLSRTSSLTKIHDLEDELDEVKDERKDLDVKVEDLWRLTLRKL